MSITDQPRYRLATKLVAAAILTVPLAACSGDETNTGSSVLSGASSASSAVSSAKSAASSAVSSASSAASSAVSSARSAASSAADRASNAVDCSGNSCSVTLSSDSAQAQVLGTSISFNGVQDGKATLRVGDRDVSCAEGDNVSAGPLTLECTTVADDGVTFTASLG